MSKFTTRLLAMAVSFLVFGCTALPDLDSPTYLQETEQTITFEATIAASEIVSDDATKTGSNPGGTIFWRPGDEISVFSRSDDNGGSRFVSHATQPEASTQFTGSLPTAATGRFQYWAIYPYSAVNRFDGTSVYLSLKDEQVSTAGSFADGQWPTVARANHSSGTNLSFVGICSGIRFSVAHQGIRSITFRNIDGGSIAGVLKVDWNMYLSTTSQISEGGTDKIVVTPAEGESFAVGSDYYVVLPPVTMSKGIEVTYETAKAKASYTNNGSISFSKGRFKSLPKKDSDLDFGPEKVYGYEPVSPDNSDWTGSFIIVDANKGFIFNGSNGTSNKQQLTAGDFEGDVITRECGEWEFNISTNGSKYFITHNGQYLYCSYNSPGNSTTGMAYDSNPRELTLDRMSNGTFGFWMRANNSDQYLYYKTGSGANYFKFGASHNGNCVRLYKSNRKSQNVSFAEESVLWNVGDRYAIGGTYPVQALSGAMTSVSYTSSNPEVAAVSGSQIRIAGTGRATITATAAAENGYSSASASYLLIVAKEGVFCLENDTIKAYFDDAEANYTDEMNSSVVSKYYKSSASNRKDIPAPVTLAWSSGSGSGSYVVNVYNDSSRKDLETSVTTTSTTVDIFNLIPNRDYWYTVTRNSSTVASGTFSTEGRRRMLKVSDTYDRGHANNCRDLGGMKTLDGKTLNYNLIFRGSNLNAVTTAEKEYLTGYMNIRMDVDLRTTGSGQYGATRVFAEGTGVGYSNAKFNNWNDLQNASKIKTTFTDIINTIKAGNACYIHCYSGADRTGYICLLIEAVLGVSPKDCSIDYELTSFSVVGLRGRDGSKDSSDTTYITEGMNKIKTYSKGSTFQEKAENILLDAGVTAQQISDLRKAMLD